MEFKRTSGNRHGQRRIVVPARDGVPPTPVFKPQAEKKPLEQRDLAADRSLFGFDDIPVDDEELENVRFRDILGAWAKQSIKHSPIEKKQDQLAKFKNEKLKSVKNDLKWALMADLDEPVKQRPKQPEPRQTPHHPTSTQASAVHAISTPHATHSVPKTIDINISVGALPKIPWDKLKRTLLVVKLVVFKFIMGLSKKQRIGLACIIVFLVVLGFVPQLVRQWTGTNESAVDAGTPGTTVVTPDFATLLPQGKTTTDVGGFHRISPPKSAPAYAFSDTLRGATINVTEQQIPNSFKSDVDASIAKLAKDYAANDKVTVGSTTVYVGTSHTGPQSVIFTKNNLLIFIRSTSKVENNAWSWYADNLH